MSNLNTPVKDLGLHARVWHPLVREGYPTVGDLIKATRADLTDIRQFGVGALDDVENALAKLGLRLSR